MDNPAWYSVLCIQRLALGANTRTLGDVGIFQIIKTFWPFDIWALFNPACPHWPGVADKKFISWQTLFRFQLDHRDRLPGIGALWGKGPGEPCDNHDFNIRHLSTRRLALRRLATEIFGCEAPGDWPPFLHALKHRKLKRMCRRILGFFPSLLNRGLSVV
jgi:hypothetical protein